MAAFSTKAGDTLHTRHAKSKPAPGSDIQMATDSRVHLRLERICDHVSGLVVLHDNPRYFGDQTSSSLEA